MPRLPLTLLLACIAVWHGSCSGIFTGANKLSAANIAELTAVEAVGLLCSRQLTAVQYAETLLERMSTYECLNGWAFTKPAKVLEDAKAVDEAAASGKDIGPLCGLAFAVKDNIDVLGYPTAAGTPALEGMMPNNSSSLVTKLISAHGVVLGKTRMHELAEGVTSINVHRGPVLNPYNNAMHVGGSSGGTTAVVAMRMAPAGFCSDTGGSCRIPASVTGVLGFRPTTGCWPAADGIVPMTTTRDTVGVNARSMADVKLFNGLFSDCGAAYRPVAAQGLRVGYPRNFWGDLGWETEGVFGAALEAMRAAGVELVPMDMDLVIQLGRRELPDKLFYTYEYPRELSRYMYTHGYNISLVDMVDKIASPLVKTFLTALTYRKLDTFPTPADYARALGVSAPKLKALWESYHDTYNVSTIVVPATPITSRPVSDVEPYLTHNGKKWENYEVYGRTVKLDCALNVPGLAMPIGLASDGMPVGIMFHARPGDDAVLLSVGEAMEAVLPATPAPPEVAACAGCMPRVKVVDVTWDGVGQPKPTDTTSCYELELDGDCRYMPDKAAMTDMRFAVIRAKLTGLPPALVLTAEAAGVPTEYKQFNGTSHGFLHFSLPQSEEAMDMSATALGTAFGLARTATLLNNQDQH